MFGVIFFVVVQVFLVGFTRAQCDITCNLCKEISEPPDSPYIGNWNLVNPTSSRCELNVSCLYRRDDDGKEMCFCDPGPFVYEECEHRPDRTMWTCNDCYMSEVPLFQLFSNPSKPFDKITLIKSICEEESNVDNCTEILPTFWVNHEKGFWSGFWAHLCDYNDCKIKTSSGPLTCDSCIQKISHHYSFINYAIPANLTNYYYACSNIFGDKPSAQQCVRLIDGLLPKVHAKLQEVDNSWVKTFCEEEMGCGGHVIGVTSEPTVDPGSSTSDVWTCGHCSKGSSALLLQLVHYSQLDSHADELQGTICPNQTNPSYCSAFLKQFWPEFGKHLWFWMIPTLCDDLKCSPFQDSLPTSKLSCKTCVERIHNHTADIFHPETAPFFHQEVKYLCTHSVIFEDAQKCEEDIDSLLPSIFSTFHTWEQEWVDNFCLQKMDCSLD